MTTLTQAEFLNKVIKVLGLKNDAAFSRQIDVAPPVISKVRNDKMPLGASVACRISKLTGWPIEQIEKDLGFTF